MSVPSVLVTGVGAIIGQGIIKSLRMEERPVRIVGLDLNPNAYASHFCDSFYIKPSSEEGAEYLEFLSELICKEGVNLILPGIEHDIFFFDSQREFFERLNSFPVLNKHDLIDIARDKWKTANVLMAAGIQTIPGMIPNNWQDCVSRLGPPPLLLKPRYGNGSRGIVMLSEERDFEYWAGKHPENFLIQKIVGTDDQEYTASVFGFGDGGSTIPIIFRRKLSSNGSTLSAEIVQNSLICDLINRLNTLFESLGPTNYQFRIDSEKVYLLEVNPRISSATSFRAAFNYNEAWMSIDYFLNGIRPSPQAVKNGCALRYVEDYIGLL